jgi:hypothetical protein
MSNRTTQNVERDVARPVRALSEKIVDQSDIEAGRVSVDLLMPAADDAAGNDGLGHRGNPCSRTLGDTGVAKAQRTDAAPATCRGC